MTKQTTVPAPTLARVCVTHQDMRGVVTALTGEPAILHSVTSPKDTFHSHHGGEHGDSFSCKWDGDDLVWAWADEDGDAVKCCDDECMSGRVCKNDSEGAHKLIAAFRDFSNYAATPLGPVTFG